MRVRTLSLVLGLVLAGLGGLLLTTSTTMAIGAQVPAAQSTSNAQRTAWYFYRVKWGHQDEFLDLFQKNHYPVLKDQIRTGRIVAVRVLVPTYHGDGRADWTVAVAITYKDTAAMTGPSGEAEITRRLYPDQATFSKEERRRFEIVDAHWDTPLNELDLEARVPAAR